MDSSARDDRAWEVIGGVLSVKVESPSRSIAVFCGASAAAAPLHIATSEEVGGLLGRRGWTVFYGGTDVGLMGALADGVRKSQGSLVGVVPKLAHFSGRGSKQLSRLIEVEDLSHRKKVLVESCGMYLVLPGGLGTLDEMFEVLALESVQKCKKRIILFNELEFFRPVLEMLDMFVQQRFISPHQLECMAAVESLAELERELTTYEESF